jgi:rare lipoprotein A
VLKTAPAFPALLPSLVVALKTAPAFPALPPSLVVALKTAPAFPALPPSLVVVFLVFCSACTVGSKGIAEGGDSAPVNVPVNVMAVPDAVPKYERRTRAGNPPEYEVLGKNYKVLAESKGYQQRGIASWYGTKFHGRNTSNGEVYNMYAMTAAHKTLPIPSYVRVTNLSNSRSVVVRINDRGPFHANRIIDLSYTAAVKLGIQKTGTGRVEVTALEFVSPELAGQKTSQNAQTQDKASCYLQMGAFSRLANARQLQDRLVSLQINGTRVLTTGSQQLTLYKVQIGPFDSEQQAHEARKKLMLLGLTDVTFISHQASWKTQ